MSREFETWTPEQRLVHHRRLLLASAPRLLSALNRCPVSASSGSLDREYWGWCTKDFANYDLQRAVYPLAWLWAGAGKDNPYAGQGAVRDWTAMAVRFWLRGQDAGGGFDHLYPLERSWMAAAFTLVDMVGAWDLLADKLPGGLRRDWLAGMVRAGTCLVRRDEEHGFISNHRGGAAAGLLGLARLSGDEAFARRAVWLVEGILERQSPEGFFLEYEGADPGYETLGLHYLAKVQRELEAANMPLAGDVRAAVARSLDFVSYFVHPDGSLGGEYGSRACPQIFAGGLEFWARRLPVAEAIAARTAPALAAQRAAGPADADIRNEVPLLSSVVLALQSLAEPCPNRPAAAELPHLRDFERIWTEAGLFVRSQGGRYLVFGASKGGAVKAYNGEGLQHSDAGYTARTAGGAHLSTHIWQQPRRFAAPGLEPGAEHPPRDEGRVEVEAAFLAFKPGREMTPLRLTLFRIFNQTLGRWQVCNDLVRKLIIRVFLTGKSKPRLWLRREVHFADGGAEIRDSLDNPHGLALRELTTHGFFATVYMASARYFRMGDLRQAWSRPCAGSGASGPLGGAPVTGWEREG